VTEHVLTVLKKNVGEKMGVGSSLEMEAEVVMVVKGSSVAVKVADSVADGMMD
jgi:hypothetical protein